MLSLETVSQAIAAPSDAPPFFWAALAMAADICSLTGSHRRRKRSESPSRSSLALAEVEEKLKRISSHAPSSPESSDITAPRVPASARPSVSFFAFICSVSTC